MKLTLTLSPEGELAFRRATGFSESDLRRNSQRIASRIFERAVQALALERSWTCGPAFRFEYRDETPEETAAREFLESLQKQTEPPE